VQNPSQTLKSVKGLGNTFELSPKWERTLPFFDIFYGLFIGSPQKKSKYQSWYLTPCCWLEVHNPTQALKSVKGLGNTFDLNSKWGRTLPSFDIFLWVIYRVPLPKKNPNIKVDIWHPAVGLRCIIPPRHLCQLKALAISLTLNTKWERHLPSFDISLWIIYKVPPKSKYQSWYLNPCCGLVVHNPTQALKSVKDLDNTFDLNSSGKELCRPSIFFYRLCIGSPPNPNIKVDIWHPVVDLRCIVPPRHLSQLTALTKLLI
jgi:hypothetical protein